MPKGKISFTFATHQEGHPKPGSDGKYCLSQFFFPETISATRKHQAMFGNIYREAKRLVGEDSAIEAYPHWIKVWWRSTEMSDMQRNAAKGELDDIVHGALDSCFKSDVRTFAHMTGILKEIKDLEGRSVDVSSAATQVF